MPFDPKDLTTLTPTFFNTIYKHVRHESPDANWDLKLHLGVAMVRSFLARSKHKTIERQQKFLQRYHIPTPPSVVVNKTTVPESCRSQAEDIMSGLLSGMEERVGWRWREDPAKKLPLRAEWVDIKSRRKTTTVERVVLYVHGGGYFLGSAAQHRFMVQKVARAAGARAFSIDYRLAPQSPFPAAVIDTLAAYLYLTSPTTGAGINPKNIVIMGDSAGGGLTLATLMVLRDAGLPMPAAGVCWSPWVDMFHSLPSILTNADTDYIPNGFVHKPSPANPIKDYRDVKQRLARIQYYAYNSALDIPYVSPILADDLGGLGQLFINCGNGERLRDESVLLAHKAAKTHPEIFESAHSPGQPAFPPTQVTLHVYDAMPHVFQMFGFHPCAINSVNRTAAFIRKAIPEPSLERTSTMHTLASLSDIPTEHSSHDNSRSLDDDDSAFADDDFYFVKRHFDVKGALRESDYTDVETLGQWCDMLGRLPDLKKHPEFLEV